MDEEILFVDDDVVEKMKVSPRGSCSAVYLVALPRAKIVCYGVGVPPSS